MTRDFDDLVGGDLSPDERRRLEEVHEMLLAAGPPPDLPAALREPPAPADLDAPLEMTTWCRFLPGSRVGAAGRPGR